MTRALVLTAVVFSLLAPAFAAAAPLLVGPPGWSVSADREPADEPRDETPIPDSPAPAEDGDGDTVHALPRRFAFAHPSLSAYHERQLPADPLNHRPQPVEPPPNRASRP